MKDGAMHPSGDLGSLLVRNTTLNLVGQLAPILAGLFAIPYIISRLGIDGFGILSLSWVIMGNMAIFNLGISRAVTKFMAESLGRNETEALPHIVWNSVYFQAAIGIAGGAILAALSPYLVTKVFNIPAPMSAETVMIFYVIASSLPFILLSETFSGVLQAAQRFDLVNAVKVPMNTGAFLLPALAVWLGSGLVTIVGLLFLTKVLASVIYLALCLKAFPVLATDLSVHPRKLGKLMAFGGWLTVSNILSPVLIYFERFFIVSLLSVGMLTYYSAPFEMISRVIVFPTSIALTTFPTFSYYGAGNRHVLENIFSRSIKYLAFVMTPTAVFFVAFSRDVLGAWLGAAFASQSTALLQILTVTFLAHAFAYVPLTAVQGLGRADLKAKLDLVEVPLFLALLYLLIRAFGLNGAGVAKLVVTLVDVAFLFWFTEKIGKFSLRRMMSTTLAPTLCLSALLAAGTFPLLACGNVTVKSVLFAVFVSIYAILFWRMAFDGADKKVVYGILQKIRRKGR